MGVDFGTLSGRAVVVRVSDGAELGSAVTDYPNAVIERTLPETGERLGSSWALQDPDDWREVLRKAVPAAVKDAGVDPDARRRHRHRLHRLDAAAGARRRHPAVRDARVPRPAARLPEALEAPRRPGAGRPHHRARRRAQRAVAGPLRRHDLLRVAVREGAAGAGGGRRGLRRDGPLDRGRRLDRLGAVRRGDAQRVHRRLQGHPPGRPLPLRGVPRRARRALRALPGRQARARRALPARRPRRLADRRGGRVDRAARGHRGGGRQRRRPRHGARRPGDRARHDGGDHGHLDVPRDERRAAGRGAGHVRRGPRRDHARAVGLRGRPERGRRHLRLVRRPPRRARVPRGGRAPAASRCTPTSPSSRPSRRSASTGSSRSTGRAATARCWSTTTSAA